LKNTFKNCGLRFFINPLKLNNDTFSQQKCPPLADSFFSTSSTLINKKTYKSPCSPNTGCPPPPSYPFGGRPGVYKPGRLGLFPSYLVYRHENFLPLAQRASRLSQNSMSFCDKKVKNLTGKKERRTFMVKNSLHNSTLIDSVQKPSYDFKKRLYTSYSKFTEVKLITIGIASPLRILQWAEKTLPNGKIYGEVLNANTLHHKTFKPQKGGLFCERIFGPLKDFECSCGKVDKTAKRSTVETDIDVNQSQPLSSKDFLNEEDMKKKKKQTRKVRKFCPDCDVEYTWSVIRRYQLGYIKLISPVTHVWFLKGTPSYLSIVLDLKKRNLQSVTYCSETLTIEHMDLFGNAFQSFKTSGFELDSPSKIYASWMEARQSDDVNKKKNQTNSSSVLPVFFKNGEKENFENGEKENFENGSSSGGRGTKGFSTVPFSTNTGPPEREPFSKKKATVAVFGEHGSPFGGRKTKGFSTGKFASTSTTKTKYLNSFKIPSVKQKRLNTIDKIKNTIFSNDNVTNEKSKTYNQKNKLLKQDLKTNRVTPRTKFFIQTNKLTNLKEIGNLVSEQLFAKDMEENLQRKFSCGENELKRNENGINLKKNLFLDHILKKSKQIKTNFKQFKSHVNKNDLKTIKTIKTKKENNLFVQPDVCSTNINKIYYIRSKDENKDFIKNKRFCLLHVLYMLQMGLIYKNLIKNFEADMPFNIQIHFIQKEFLEKELAESTYGKKKTKEFMNSFNDNSPLNEKFMNFFNEKNIPLFAEVPVFFEHGESRETFGFSTGRLNKNGEYSEKKLSGSEKRKRKKLKSFKKISKKLPIHLYIKSSLETKLHKKIMGLSFLKTWQHIYKNSYLKAMHKTTSYFFSLGLEDLSFNKQQNVSKQFDAITKWRKPEFPKSGKIMSNNKFYIGASSATNVNMYTLESFYKKNKSFVRKISLKHMKKIIELMKIYFKKKMLITLRNLKQPLFSLQFNVQNASLFKSIVTQSDPLKLIPIPLSYSQILNETSENIQNFLSIDLDFFIDVFAGKGFSIPFFLGEFLNEIKDYLILNTSQLNSKDESNVFFQKRIFNGFLQNSSSFWEKKTLQILPLENFQRVDEGDSLPGKASVAVLGKDGQSRETKGFSTVPFSQKTGVSPFSLKKATVAVFSEHGSPFGGRKTKGFSTDKFSSVPLGNETRKNYLQSTSSHLKNKDDLNQITLNLQRIFSQKKKRKNNYDIISLEAYKNALVLSKNLLKKKETFLHNSSRDSNQLNSLSSPQFPPINGINNNDTFYKKNSLPKAESFLSTSSTSLKKKIYNTGTGRLARGESRLSKNSKSFCDKVGLDSYNKEKSQLQMLLVGSQFNVSSLLPFNLLNTNSGHLSLLSLNKNKDSSLLNEKFYSNRTILREFLLEKSSDTIGHRVGILTKASLMKKKLAFLISSRGSIFKNLSQNELYKKQTNSLEKRKKLSAFGGEFFWTSEGVRDVNKKVSFQNNLNLIDGVFGERVHSLQNKKSIKNGKRKLLYNNIYTLSHRERWGNKTNEGKDWQIFSLYSNSYASQAYGTSYKDQAIYAYKHRLSSIASNLNMNSYSKYSVQATADFFKKNGTVAKGHLSAEDMSGESKNVSQNMWMKNKPDYSSLMNNSFFSGPGIVQQLLNELNFSEMKKLDKQNRLLLYILNKSIFQLKKQVRLFIYDKNAQAEMKDLCKKRDLLIRRTKLVRKLFRKNTEPSSMILTVLPVLPPDLRPIVKMGEQIAASDLNRFYQRVIYRNDRLKKFLKDPATSNSYEMKYAQRLLQESVDNLIQNGQSGGEKDSRGRVLKSLSDILKGKQGRFRQFLLGKRVDYSGRSVIVVGPKLKLYECGIPLEMALELYLPFLLKTILNKNYSKTVVGAKALIKKNRPLALELLREIMQVSPVLLNRAPTLHRLGFQAFVPKLVEGRAILLHPLVCSSFNADFDGDQMAVHVPITIESRAEAWKLMLSRNNMLSPSTGDPLSIPSQDMVLGCYYLTTNSNKSTLPLLRGSGFFFQNLDKVLYAYNSQKIDLHALVWLKWMNFIENGNDQEEPVEIRMTGLGNWQELSYNYIRNYNSSSKLMNQYMSTTPGRILFYSLIQKILKA